MGQCATPSLAHTDLARPHTPTLLGPMPTCGCTGSADSAGSRDGLRRCVLHNRGGRRIVILAEIEPCGKWMMQSSVHHLHKIQPNCMCSSCLVVWWSGVRGPVAQCSGVWPGCEARVAVDMLLLGLC